MEMGKWKKMGKNRNKDVIVCPKCKNIFYNRYKRKCPNCRVLLIYPNEGIGLPTDEEAFMWLGEWVNIKDAKFDIDIIAVKTNS
jgi:hypothetical protein